MGKSVQKKIGIIGAGNLGTSIAISLKNFGFPILFNSSFYNNEIRDIINEIDIEKFVLETNPIFIAVKDKDIRKKVNLLKNLNIRGKTIIHFSGFHTSDILSELKNKGADIGSFHPIISIPEKYIDINKIRGKLYASYEGGEVGERVVKEIFGNLNFEVFNISKNDKILFHLTLTLLSNYPFYVFELGKLLFDKIDFKYDKKEFKNNFIETSVKNYLKTGKISGPLSRGDYAIIDAELNNINEKRIKKLVDKIIKLSYEIKREVNNEKS